ncbi:MAG: hypothetical protein KF875_09490 [Trueperaceae bacterium]|nr:hypothetical protein [Trueperaceae bacterium]MCW5820469.1 hypothetical protein [Trueperaceae bacterium]
MALLVVVLVLAAGAAHAQGFDENRYYQQCLRFEAGGDLETGRQACLNALQIRPDFAAAELALARIELGLGEVASAENRLRRVRNRIDTAEPIVLLAEAALANHRPGDAEALLQEAKGRLATQGNVELQGRVAFLQGRIMQSQGRFGEALDAYADAILGNPLDVGYRLADARLRLRLGEPASAEQQLQSYINLTGDDRNPDVRSLMGRAQWANGELDAANGNIATAHQLRGVRNVSAQADDLRALALIAYAQGDVDAGGLAMRESLKRENLTSFLRGNSLIWLLLLVLLVGAHLIGESRIASSSTLEVVDGPRNWSVGQVYSTLFAALLLALLVTVVYGLVRYDNSLAIVTPPLRSETHALFVTVFAVLLALLAWRRVQSNGFDAMETLLGGSRFTSYGIGWGALFLAATLAYLHYFDGGLGRFYLDFVRVSPFVVAAAFLVPLAEIYFRPFVMTPLTRRYDGAIAAVASASLSAIAFGTPTLLLVVMGLLLADAYRRRRSGWEVLVAQLTMHLGLLAAALLSPWVRALFY